MNTYQFNKFEFPKGNITLAIHTESSTIPFDMDNRDYQQFLLDWKAGAEVLDADGKPVPYSDDAVKALGLEP